MKNTINFLKNPGTSGWKLYILLENNNLIWQARCANHPRPNDGGSGWPFHDSNTNQKHHVCVCELCVCASRNRPAVTLCDPTDYSLPGSLFMRFSMQEHWRGLLCPPPGDLPYPGVHPASLTSPALAGGFFTTSATWEAPECSLAGTKLDKWKVEHFEDGFTDHDDDHKPSLDNRFSPL